MEQKMPKRWQKVLRPAAALGRLFIPNLGTLLLVGLLFWAQQAGALGGRPQGIAPNVLPGIITYQGKLTDKAGNPITGNLRMTFALYNVPTGGTALWSETYDGANAVPVQGGEFVVHLGSINPIPAAVMEQSPLYLGVAVAGDGEMTPRAVVSAVHVAFAAQEAIDNFRVPGNLVNEGRFYLGGSRTTVAGTLEHETVHTSDRAFIVGTYTGQETSDLRLYILDNPGDRFSIWGDSCGGGNCGDLTAASEAHRFYANGDVWHKGKVVGGLEVSGGFTATEALAGGPRLMTGKSVGSYTIGSTTGTLWEVTGCQGAPQPDGPTTSGGGFGFVSAGNQISPIMWMYDFPDNDFRIIKRGWNRNITDDPVLLRLDVFGNFYLPIWGATFDRGWGGYPSISFPDTQELRIHAVGGPSASLRVDGNIYSGGGIQAGTLIAANLQSAEELASERISRFSQGDLLCWDAQTSRLEKCASLASPLVVAVADESGKPIVLGAEPVKVLGPVQPGDLLVASDTPGYAVAWSQVGTGSPPVGVVIAKALEGFSGERGMVKAMILGR